MNADDDAACRDLVELLTAYLDDELPAPDRAQIEAHLADCPGCSAALQQMRESIRVTGTLSQDDVPELQRTALQEAFRSWRARSAPPDAAG